VTRHVELHWHTASDGDRSRRGRPHWLAALGGCIHRAKARLHSRRGRASLCRFPRLESRREFADGRELG
jgi:hypothetical protein